MDAAIAVEHQDLDPDQVVGPGRDGAVRARGLGAGHDGRAGEGAMWASDRGAERPARSPRPWVSIQIPAAARPRSISSTMMINAHGRRAAIGSDSAGASTTTAWGRGDDRGLGGAAAYPSGRGA